MSLMTRFLTEEMSVKPYVRFGAGKTIYGEPEVRRCRVEPADNVKIVYKNPSGTITETVASALIFCEGSPIPINSIVNFHGRETRVIDCKEMYGFGLHHLEVSVE